MAVAPWRAQRPGAVRNRRERLTKKELAECPFCAGREGHTPPETFALGPPDRRPDTPGWQVRVVPNKYPAFEHHEVVVHTPRHVRSVAELTDDEVRQVAQTWQARGGAARAAGFGYVQAALNEGRAAGASLPHSHSQLVWLHEAPPELQAERRQAHGCAICDTVRRERRERVRVVLDSASLRVGAACPYASRAPYELLIAPHHHEPDAYAAAHFEDALLLLAEAVRRLQSLEGPVPLNAWLHSAPFGDDGHWHLHMLPRLSIHAGLELGAGIYVNSLAPEEAAARLRGA